MNQEENKKMKTRQEIAEELGIHRDTLRCILKKNNLKIPKGLVAPKHQKLIKNIIHGNSF